MLYEVMTNRVSWAEKWPEKRIDGVRKLQKKETQDFFKPVDPVPKLVKNTGNWWDNLKQSFGKRPERRRNRD